MKTFLRRLLWSVGTLAVLLGFFHLIENVRGRRAWQARKAGQEALGMRYDLAAYAPPAVAEADNFAAAPCIAGAVAGKGDGSNWTLPGVFIDVRTAGDWREGRPLDPGVAEAELKGQNLEAFLQPFEGRLDAIAEAARRPGSRLLIDHSKPEDVPLLLDMRARMRVLRLRALARLQAGRAEAALEDVLTGLRMVQHLQHEPHLISQLLRAAWASLVLQPVWEGLQGRMWNEAQLARLEAALAPIDLLASMKLALRFERCGMAANLARAGAGDLGALLPSSLEGAQTPGRALRWAMQTLIPKGWVAQNIRALDEAYAEGIEAALDPARHRVHPNPEAWRALNPKRTPYTMLVPIVVPALAGQNPRIGRIVAGIDQARVACALERWRRAEGGYPETLEALAPRFLAKVPHDVATGAPLRYARTEGAYRLFSIGWNGTDEGGTRAREATEGDWVWSTGEPARR